MQLTQIGPRGYTVSSAVDSKAFTPLFDRAAKVTDFRITSPSADDQWTISVGGKEIFRGLVKTSGYMNPFGNSVVLGVDNRSWLPFISDLLGREITVPVPQGQTITIASVGGATADIAIEYEEVSPADIQPSMPNHYQGNETYHPMVQYRDAAIAAAGTYAMDTQITSPWVPSLLHGSPVPVNWRMEQLAIWSQAASINTYSGAADHISSTQEIQGVLNGQTLFTRDQTGMPLVPQSAATGAANTVILPALVRANAFQLMPIGNNQEFDPPIVCQGGDNFEYDVVYSGSFTGNPQYNLPLIMALLHVVGQVGG